MPQIQNPESKGFMPTVEEMKDRYRQGYVTARELNNGLRKRGQTLLQQRLETEGFWRTTALNTIDTYKDAWTYLHDVIHAQELPSEQARKKNLSGIDISKTIPTKGGDVETFVNDAMIQSARYLKGVWNLFWAPIEGPIAPTVEEVKHFFRFMNAPKGFTETMGVLTDVALTTALTGKGSARLQAQVAKGAGEAATSVKNFFSKVRLEDVQDALKKGMRAEGIKAGTLADIAPSVEGAASAAEDTAPKFTGAVQEGLAKYKEMLSKQARGVGGTATRPVATAEETAKSLPNMSLEEIGQTLKPGQVLNQEETVRLLHDLKPHMDNLIDLGRKVSLGEASYADAEAAGAKYLQPIVNAIAPQIEAGRAIQIHEPLTEVTHEQAALRQLHEVFLDFNPEAAANGNWEDAGKSFWWAIGSIKKPEEGLEIAVQAAAQARDGVSLGQAIRGAWTNVLLLPRSWVRKATGDFIGAANHNLQLQLGGWVSENKIDGLTKDAGWKNFLGTQLGLQHVLGIGPFSDINLGPMTKAAHFQDIAEPGLAAGEGVVGKITEGLNAFRPSTYVMQSITDKAQDVTRFATRYRLALTEAENQHIVEKDIPEFVAKFVTNPPNGVRALEERYAGAVTYTEPLGVLGRIAQKVQNSSIVPGWLWAPFVKIPANLTNGGVGLTPGLGLLARNTMRDLAEGGEIADLTMGRFLESQILGQTFYGLAKAGLITGGGPTDPAQRRIWLQKNKPYSFVWDNGDGTKRFYNYSWMEPVSKPMGAIADFATMADYLPPDNALGWATGMTTILARDYTVGTYMETFNRIWEKAQQIEQGKFGPFIEGILTPLTNFPLGSYGRVTAEYLDNHVKDADGLLDQWKANIPFLRSGVPSSHDIWTGEPRELPTTIGGAALAPVLPFTYGTVKNDPVVNEMDRLGVPYPVFGLARGKVPATADPEVIGNLPPTLTTQERQDWIKTFATMGPEFGVKPIHDRLNDLIGSDIYKSLPEEAQRNELHSAIQEHHGDSWDVFLSKRPDLQAEMEANTIGRELRAVPEGQRPQLEQAIRDALNREAGRADATATSSPDTPFPNVPQNQPAE